MHPMGSEKMPTNIALRRRRSLAFPLFAVLIGLMFFALEAVDPVALKVEASQLSAP